MTITAVAHYDPPKQARSRDTYRRILAATEALLREKTFQELTIAEIVAAAGCSEGPFYARFGDKGGFLRHLEERFYADREDALAVVVEIGRDSCADPRETLGRMLRVMVDLYRTHAGLHGALLLHARQDAGLRERLDRWERANLQRASRVLAAGAAGGAVSVRRLELALFVVRSAVRDVVFFGGRYASRGEVDDARLCAELADLLVAYFRRP